MGFIKIFWKNNVQEAYLPKMSISGQIVCEILAELCTDKSIQILQIFLGRPPKNFEGFVWNCRLQISWWDNATKKSFGENSALLNN